MSGKILQTNLSLLRMCGINPYKNSIFDIILRLACIIAYFVEAVQCLMVIYTSKHVDWAKHCIIFVYLGIGWCGVFHLVYIRSKRQTFISIFERVEQFKNSSESEMDEVNMQKFYVMSKSFARFWATTCFLASFAIYAWPLLTSGDRKLSVPLWYPYNWKVSPYYEVTMFAQCILEIIIPTSYVAVDTIFPCIAILVVGQFKILGTASCFRNKRLNHQLKAKIEEILISQQFEEVIDDLLQKYIVFHQDILDFCRELENVFSPFMFVKVNLNLLYFCMLIFCVITANDESFLIAITMCMSATAVELFMQTYFPHLVQEMSVNVGSYIYKGPWYLCPKNFRRSIIFIQMRSHKPVKFTAGKVSKLNLESFVAFLNRILSYVAVLKSIT
ncbi:Odorant receptor Or114 [Rhyzopertha dominica]|nr:Odorant receptor Or114 [Rhyzopertha dominica]